MGTAMRMLVTTLFTALLVAGCSNDTSERDTPMATPDGEASSVSPPDDGRAEASSACGSSLAAWDIWLDSYYASKPPSSGTYTEFFEMRAEALEAAQAAASRDNRWSPLAHLIAPSWNLADAGTGDMFSAIGDWCSAEGL